MLRSRASALVSVQRVTEINAGRETAGVDGKTALLCLPRRLSWPTGFSTGLGRRRPGRQAGVRAEGQWAELLAMRVLE